MNAAGSPSTSAIRINPGSTRKRRLLPSSRNSAAVNGTKPQFCAQASLKMSRNSAISSSKRFRSSCRTRTRFAAAATSRAMMGVGSKSDRIM